MHFRIKIIQEMFELFYSRVTQNGSERNNKKNQRIQDIVTTFSFKNETQKPEKQLSKRGRGASKMTQ